MIWESWSVYEGSGGYLDKSCQIRIEVEEDLINRWIAIGLTVVYVAGVPICEFLLLMYVARQSDGKTLKMKTNNAASKTRASDRRNRGGHLADLDFDTKGTAASREGFNSLADAVAFTYRDYKKSFAWWACFEKIQRTQAPASRTRNRRRAPPDFTRSSDYHVCAC